MGCSKIALVTKAMRWYILLGPSVLNLAKLVAKAMLDMMCGEVQLEGAFDEGNARVICSESSTSTKKVTSGVIWKARATIAQPANRYSAFSVNGCCNFSIWLL